MNNLDIDVLQSIAREKYINTNILVSEFEVSTRTIRYSLSRIRTMLESYDCSLKFSNKRGYYFSKQDLIKVKILLEELAVKNNYATNSHQRRNYISGKIVRAKTCDIEKMALDLFVSSGSVLSDIEYIVKRNSGIEIKGTLVSNNMTLEQKLRLVINLVINESQKSKTIRSTNIRFFFSDSAPNLKQLSSSIKNSSLLVDNDIVEFQLMWFLLYVIEEFKLNMNDKQSITTILYEQLNSYEYGLVCSYILLLGIDNDQVFPNPLVRSFLKELENYYEYKIGNENEIIILERKIAAIKVQVSGQIDFKCSSTKRNIRLYPYSFSISQQLLNSVLGKAAYSRDQVAYISDSIQKILFESTNSRTILFVVDGDDTIAKSYSEWILSKYTKNVQIQVEQINDFQKHIREHGDNIALVINCTELSLNSKFDTLNIGSSLSIDSLNKIDKMLSVENGNYKFFQQFLSQRLLKVYLGKTSVEEVIANSAKYLKLNDYIEDENEYVDACLEREKVGTTYIGYKTMISHPIKQKAKENVLFITVLSKPHIVMGNEIQLIINCAFKSEINFNISRLFELIMKLIEVDDSLEKIVTSKSEMELLINIRNGVIKI